MPINELLVSELIAVKRLVEGNSLTGLRAALDFLPLAIAANQRRLNQLRSTEMLMLQKLRRELSMQEVDGQRADIYMKVEPMQSFLQYDTGTPDPHEYIIYDVNKLTKLPIGIMELISQQKMIASEIKQLSAAIRDLNTELEKVNETIAAKKGTNVALKKDQIAQRTISELFLLYELHVLYRDNSRTAENAEGYSSDQKLVKVLGALQLKFNAFAERNPYVLNGSLKLDLVNPGSDENGTALTNLLDKLRKTSNPGETGILDAKIKRYADNLVKNINDPDISVGIQRRTESKNIPEVSDALNSKTATTSKMIQFTQEAAKWWTVFDGKKFTDKATEAFKQRVKAVYGGLPFCDESLTTKSAEAQQREGMMALEQALGIQAADEQTKAAEATGVDTTPNATPMTPAGVDMQKYLEETAADLEKIYKQLNTQSIVTASKYLQKKPVEITEKDLTDGYKQWSAKYRQGRVDLDQTPVSVAGETKEQQAVRSKIIDKLRNDTQQAAIKTVDFKKALINYRELHGNLTPISQEWWDEPAGDPK